MHACLMDVTDSTKERREMRGRMVTEGGIDGVAERICKIDHWRGTVNSHLEKKIV